MNTPDLFVPSIAGEVVDTALIMQEYMKRPGHMANVRFGQWFAKAHNLQDNDLLFSVGNHATKLYILHKGYNRLPLEPLKALNDKYNMKEKGK